MFERALVLVTLEDRDATVLDAVVACHDRLGISKVVMAHTTLHDPLTGYMSHHGPREHSERDLAAARDALRARAPALEIEAVLTHGNPPEDAVELMEERDIDLLIMGRSPQDQSGDFYPFLHLTRFAPCSTLVVPSGASISSGRAVVGVDFSPHSTRALATAVGLFDDVTAITAVRELPFRSPDARRERLYQRFAEEVLSRIEGDAAHFEIISGRAPWDALIGRSEDACIVVGNRGLSGLAKLVLGSTAEYLNRHAPGPVLTVRPPVSRA